MDIRPEHLDLERARGLTIHWNDGSKRFYPLDWLRGMSPSAEQRALREEMARNPLTVLPTRPGGDAPLTAVDAELIGNYAIRIKFSDGHDTGIYSWTYLKSLEQELPAES
jgi:DUF971 family protein